jgi:hypothetical protein
MLIAIADGVFYGHASPENGEGVGMNGSNYSSVHERWAHLRFAVVGRLLASPPPEGELRAQLKELAARVWRHPVSGEPVHFGVSTIEAWYYQALREPRDPVRVLRRKVRKDAGLQDSLSIAIRQALLAQYANHKSWSIQLHWENLLALAEKNAELGPLPSYSTVRRFFKAQGLYKRRRVTSRRTEGAERAEARLSEREVRSYEAEYVNGLVTLGRALWIAQNPHFARRVGDTPVVWRHR